MKTHRASICLSLLLGCQLMGKTIPNYAMADLVLGQSDFVSAVLPLVPSSFSLDRPQAVVVDPVTQKVFVADTYNSRILRYRSASTLTNGAGAEAVLGQTRFSTSIDGSGDTGLDGVLGMFVDRRGRLWAADHMNNRVLMYEAAAYRASGSMPDRVYGQPDFVTNAAGTSASQIDRPVGVWLDSQDRLWVADYGNNRVLRFDAISSKPSGAAADGVLGQSDFITNGWGTSSSKFFRPMGITVSASGTLYVADYGNNRVLRFNNAAALGNGAGASRVYGQMNFTANSTGLNAASFNQPVGVVVTPGDSLWVTDQSNYRVVRFDRISTLPSGASASGVIGQPDFVTNTSRLSNRGLSAVYFQCWVDATGSLWVPAVTQHRVLRFPPDVTRPTLTVTSAVPQSISTRTLVIKGTARDTYGIAKVQYRIGSNAPKLATGTTTWQFRAVLAPGWNKITINAFDRVGNMSYSKVFRVRRLTESTAEFELISGN